MPSYNKVLLMGNLTRDPELRYTANNQAVCNVGLAVNRRYQTSDGQQREEVAFIDCEAWGRRAEVINQYLAKGRPVFVEGRLRLDSWEDQQGQKRSKLKVVIENFEFIDSRGGSEGGGGGGGHDAGYNNSQPASRAADVAAADSGPHTPIDDDDIPF
ncbi:MAG: single-stranded DNA-binding protein [Planctomycetes bacterium]|nr:single-stranded DNA-binding protein [Planctomycetota bacterium]NOG54562.1 single-stranded DNA-binding protein [Planctomycetota bacterium]